MLDSKIELLQLVPLFAGLSADELDAIATAGEKRYFEAGENLITQGEKGDTAFFILTGKASCTRSEKGQVLKDDLLPGTLAGELAMLVETVHGVTVTASGRLRALALPRQAIRGVMESRPRIAKNIAERLLVRLHSLAAELREVDGKLAEIEKAA
ncbi:MAG: cyclic nucleotide-binding domain-containing protein [Syntrophobacteraceae bacterium]